MDSTSNQDTRLSRNARQAWTASDHATARAGRLRDGGQGQSGPTCSDDLQMTYERSAIRCARDCHRSILTALALVHHLWRPALTVQVLIDPSMILLSTPQASGWLGVQALVQDGLGPMRRQDVASFLGGLLVQHVITFARLATRPT